VFLCKLLQKRYSFVIKVYLHIVVQTQHIGVHCYSTYKIVLSRKLFKLKNLDDLWITNKIKNFSKWVLTDGDRSQLIVKKCYFRIGLLVTIFKKKSLDLSNILSVNSKCSFWNQNSKNNLEIKTKTVAYVCYRFEHIVLALDGELVKTYWCRLCSWRPRLFQVCKCQWWGCTLSQLFPYQLSQ